MKLRIGYDGERYWVEEFNFLRWRKCALWNPNSSNKGIRFAMDVNYFDSQEDAYNFSNRWLDCFSKNRKIKHAVYARVV